MSRMTEGAVDQAILLASGIQTMRTQNPAQGLLDTLFTPTLGMINRSILVPATPTCPSFYYAASFTDGILLVDGTSTLDQLRGIVAGYIGGINDSRTDPLNSFYVRAGGELIAGLVSRGTRFPLGMTLAGHSLGGPVCHAAIIGANNVQGWGVSSYTHTFGAPRPGGPSFANQIAAQGGVVRWMNSDDAVPVIPPRVENFPAILPVFGVYGCIRGAHFVHPDGGVDVQLAGTLTDSALPTHATPNFTSDLVAWLASWVNDQIPSHSISEYVRRLQAAKILLTPHARPELAPKEEPVGAAPARIRQVERQQVQAFAALEGRQNAQPLVIPPASTFRYQRIGLTHTVQFQGSTVAVAGSRRQGRALARVGNAMARRYLRAAVVDVAAITQAFTAYINAAATPGSGISPTINTQYPPGE